MKTINLISTKADKTESVARFVPFLRRLAYGSLIFVIASGTAVGAAFLYMRSRVDGAVSEKNAAALAITNETTKEGLLIAVKQRATIVDKVMANQKRLDTFFDIVSQTVPKNELSAITLDDTYKTTVTAHAPSVAEAVKIIDSLLVLAAADRVTKPSLVALTLNKDGDMDVSVSFAPIL